MPLSKFAPYHFYQFSPCKSAIFFGRERELLFWMGARVIFFGWEQELFFFGWEHELFFFGWVGWGTICVTDVLFFVKEKEHNFQKN